MTTARERYEAKTKVVTFRVNQEVYEELAKVKTEAGLSFADLVKLGAGIATGEIKQKLVEMGNLQVKLGELRQAVQVENQRLTEVMGKERKEHFAKLETEARIFRLFDLGWSIEEAGFKLGFNQEEAYKHFKEWAKMRKQRQAIQTELIKKCLKKHIDELEEHIFWSNLHWKKDADIEEARRQIEHCRRLLVNPSKISNEEKSFLISEYSARV